MLFNALITTTGLLVILSFGLGIFSLIRNPKAKVVQLWFLLSMAVTIWSVGYVKSLLATESASGFLSLRIVYFGAALIPILYFHFVSTFLFLNKKFSYLIYTGYALAFIFLILNTLTDLVIKGAKYLENFGYYEDVTNLGFKLFLAYFLFFAGFSIYLLFSVYRRSDGLRRRQIFYILLASLFGFLGGISNFVMDLTGSYPYGQLIVWLYPLLITYGIYIDEIKIKIKF